MGARGELADLELDVLFTRTPTPLERLDFPAQLDPDARYRTAALSGSYEPTFVPWESGILPELGLGREDQHAYFKAVESTDPVRVGKRYRLLGHPDQFNGDVQLACPYLARGLRVRDPQYDERLHRAFAEEARRWRLLLQVDSSDAIGTDFFGGGLLFFCIRDDDLAARRFRRAAAAHQR